MTDADIDGDGHGPLRAIDYQAAGESRSMTQNRPRRLASRSPWAMSCRTRRTGRQPVGRFSDVELRHAEVLAELRSTVYGQNSRKCWFGRSSGMAAHAQLPSSVWLYHHNPLLKLGGTPFRSDCFLIT